MSDLKDKDDDLIQVIYVMGLWRSGSTVLDTALGNHPSITSVGELRNLPLLGWKRNGTCSCGTATHNCQFWSEVRRTWLDKVGSGQTSNLMALQDHFERLRTFPRIALNRIVQQEAFREYSQLTFALFGAIRQTSGRPYIVDSTKYPIRG